MPAMPDELDLTKPMQTENGECDAEFLCETEPLFAGHTLVFLMRKKGSKEKPWIATRLRSGRLHSAFPNVEDIINVTEPITKEEADLICRHRLGLRKNRLVCFPNAYDDEEGELTILMYGTVWRTARHLMESYTWPDGTPIVKGSVAGQIQKQRAIGNLSQQWVVTKAPNQPTDPSELKERDR